MVKETLVKRRLDVSSGENVQKIREQEMLKRLVAAEKERQILAKETKNFMRAEQNHLTREETLKQNFNRVRSKKKKNWRENYSRQRTTLEKRSRIIMPKLT